MQGGFISRRITAPCNFPFSPSFRKGGDIVDSAFIIFLPLLWSQNASSPEICLKAFYHAFPGLHAAFPVIKRRISPSHFNPYLIAARLIDLTGKFPVDDTDRPSVLIQDNFIQGSFRFHMRLNLPPGGEQTSSHTDAVYLKITPDPVPGHSIGAAGLYGLPYAFPRFFLRQNGRQAVTIRALEKRTR